MSNLWVAVISACAALAGVLLADLRQRGREYNDRLAQMRRETFVDLYAWVLRAQDANRLGMGQVIDLAAGTEREPIDIPSLSPELLARLQIYLDTEIAHSAKTAFDQLTTAVAAVGKATPGTSHQSARELALSFGQVSRALGVVSALIRIQAKNLDARAATRLSWWISRVLHPPRSTSDPPWNELRLHERLRRRAQELRKPSALSRREDPLAKSGLQPPLR